MNKIAANTSSIIRRAPENFKGISVKPVKSVFCAKPKKAFFILQAAYRGIIGKAILYLVMPEIVRLAVQGICKKKQESSYNRFEVQQSWFFNCIKIVE